MAIAHEEAQRVLGLDEALLTDLERRYGALAERVTVTEDTLVVDLVDGRTVSARPELSFPLLAKTMFSSAM